MMLSRAALPLLRHRSLAAPARLVASNFQIRSYARQRDDGVSKKANSNQPLRQVKASPGERVRAGRYERPSTITNPVAAPESTAPSDAFKEEYTSQDSIQTPPPPPPPEQEPSKSASEVDPEPQVRPSQPLPDLTKGIPSTLEAELNQGTGAAPEGEDRSNITEDPERPPTAPGSRGGELPRSAYVSSSDRRRSAAAKYVYLALALGGSGYLLYLGRNWDSEEEAQQNVEAPNGYSIGAMYKRMQARLGTTVSYYSDPVSTKLLPDEETDPNMRMPFVLVLSMEDLLVHSEWSRQSGYRIAKRPGVDYFLKYLSQYYELVLFTSQPSFVADQVLRKLDPYSIIRFPLFREHTLYKDGGYVKDLSYLNRDLKKVLIMDTDSHHVMNQPENAIVIPKWTGDPNDQTLIQFIPFLEYLATMGFDDARTVLKSFEGKFIPSEFARREKALREKFDKEQAGKRRSKGGSGFGIGSIFGARQPTQGVINAAEASAEGKMIWDQIREQGQRNYEAFEKKIQEDGAKWLAERDAEIKRLEEEAQASMKSNMFGWFGSKSATEGGKQ